MSRLCISSLVVQADPSDRQNVKTAIEALADTEVMGENEQGKLVVVLDTDSNRTAADRIGEIQHLDGVLSATLIYQYDDHVSQAEDRA